MTKTKYYDLQMDDPQDDYDVDVVNANLKKIDEQMKTRENATDALQEPEFTVAAKRENIASKEKMPKILGKIAKFFADLKAVAFTGNYNDLINKPTSMTANGGNSSTVNGHSVNSDVPANAKFTDTNTWRPVETTLTNQDLNTIVTPGFYNAGGGNTVKNKPSGVDIFGMYVIHRASGTYYTQILFIDNKSYRRYCVNGTWGTWSEEKLTDTTYSAASRSKDGLMSSTDKTKLDGLVKYAPDGSTITADKNGTLHGADTIKVDGVTITKDDATKVIALAKTLQTKIGTIDNMLPKANVLNNNTTTKAGFALDARQANPNVKGTMAASIAQINSNLANYLNFDGSKQFWNPVLDINKFYTGIALFNETVTNLPTKSWYLVLSAGVSDTRVQIAWELWTSKQYFRHVVSGAIGAWQEK